MAKKSAKTRRTATKKRAVPKAKGTKKRATPKRSTTAKKRVTTKAKARKTTKAKKRVTAKAKTTKTTKAKKRVTTKAKARKTAASKSRTTAKKKVTTKAKATRKTRTRKVVVKTTTRRTKKAVPVQQTTAEPKQGFDFNKWLLPTLDLERYEPEVIKDTGIKDNIKGSTRYAWIGAGQCGGRLLKSFYDLGYKKVLAVNTAHNDLDLLGIPAGQKYSMDIGGRGAGKDMSRGNLAIQKYQQEILHLTSKTFGSQVDHIMVCVGAGGGTGGGSVRGLVEIAKRYARYIGLDNPDKKVGVILTLPTVGEASSPLVAQNAHDVAAELSNMATQGKLSPLIIIDNEKISRLYPGMTVKSFWPSINSSVAGLFDIFNRLSSLSSPYTAFDAVDYHSIMESGGCSIMGITRVDQFNNKFAISEAMKRNLEKTLLADGFDLATAKLAGCIVVGGKKLMSEVKGLQDNINYAFDVLSEVTGNATIHRGIYEDNKNSLRVYTVIGGLASPVKRLEELTSCMAVSVG